MQQTPTTNNTQMRTAAIVTIVVIIGILLLARVFTGGTNNNDSRTSDTIDNTNNGNAPLNPQNNNGDTPLNPQNNNTTDTSNLGPVVTSSNVDRDNCAVGATRSFDNNDPIYVVLEDSQLPRGTSMFARLYRDGQGIEDTRELVAEEDYNNTCVSFVFEPTDSAGSWDSGNYEVEFYVNGNAYQSTSFEIR